MKVHSRAFSLVVVLVALAIMSVLVLALLSGASRGLRYAQGDASLARETMLADTAAALVMGQIQQATSATNQAWISQPGLIRTYAGTNSTRKPTACYKLYSAPQMVDSSGGVAFITNDVPADWNSTANASVYTDLNSSAQTLGGNAIYPILDSRAVTGTSQVTGLSSDSGHAVEMPVAWLYELQDGTLGSPSAATATNPIVGRIAFWTDDETSKVDINTAGEGSPWNTPRTNSSDDTNYAGAQPASGEFERYPGHPAGVSLDVVFGTNAPNLSSDQLLALTPRYNSGGSEFGTNTTTAASIVPPKTDRLYGSVDELGFSAALNASNQRVPSLVTPDELNINRFVLTAHSHSPETTLLGEPRIAIWPVSDALTDSTRTTAADRAVAGDATLGPISNPALYYFQRHNAANGTDDLNPAIVPGNTTLFTNLVNAGSESVPGYSGTFLQKYPGAQWSQLMLEILDAIRGFNAVDPAAGSLKAPTSFVPFAQGDNTGAGRGLVAPLTSTYQSTSLRALGRYPTLFGLTLVLYISGYQFTDGTTIDYETAPDDLAGSNWKANFLPSSTSNRWKQVNKALVRAFLVPTTFQPNCGFPEVSDACSIRINGLNNLTASCKTSTGATTTGNFGFPAACTSGLLSDALKLIPADRAWGGFEGPLAWNAAAFAATNSGPPYAFTGTQAVAMPLLAAGDDPSAATSWPSLNTVPLAGLTAQILDHSGNVMQTFAISLPAVSGHLPTANGEADHYDDNGHADWSTNSACAVQPSYYMTLKNRLLTTQRSRPLIIEAGDLSYSIEAHTDLRLVASLASVPSTFFNPLPASWPTITTAQQGTHRNDLRFADGTSACFCETQDRTLVSGASYAITSSSFPVIDWRDGTTKIPYPYSTSPPDNGPTDPTYVTLAAPGVASSLYGDWDAGPGFAPDGALANLPDAGTTFDPVKAYQSLSGGEFGDATRRSPNALVPSPVVFGSLPAGVNPAQPTQSQAWRTLLFCPYPACDQAHPGLASPPDYLLLDRFWMPVVEPYGISTRFETAGKINLNDQIAPFTYLHRNTALHALLHNLRIPALSKLYTTTYKSTTGAPIPTIWKPIDENAAITQIESRFAKGDAYLTEGEICSVPLVPANIGSATPESYWASASGGGFLSGDNLRELPYAEIYSRLTTRSNSYTIHIRAQVLQKLNDHANPAVWREGVDHVLGDWRGSYEIERYLDPAATAPAPAQPNGTPGDPLGPYKIRIVSARRFTP